MDQTQLEKFNNLKAQFDLIAEYEKKVEFWLEYGFPSLTCSFDYLKQEISFDYKPVKSVFDNGKKWKNFFYKNRQQDVEFVEVISIVPENEYEFNKLLVITLDHTNILGELEVVSVDMINLFLDSIETSKLPTELLQVEIERVEKIINTYEKFYDDGKYYSEPLRIVFEQGYNNILYGVNNVYDASNLFQRMYIDHRHNLCDEYYKRPEEIFLPFLKGIAYAEYKSFLNEFIKKYESGKDVSEIVNKYKKNENFVKIKSDISNVKLLWNSDNSVLYDLFSQLMLCSNGRGEPVISNTLDSLAQFLHENVDGLPTTKTIKRQLEKMRSSDSIDTPKRNRIVISIKDK